VSPFDSRPSDETSPGPTISDVPQRASLTSGRALDSMSSAPRAISVHVRALRRYVLTISLVVWPVRSITHVSVLPHAKLIVTNVARRSCARIGLRVSERSKSAERFTPARLRSRRSCDASLSTLMGTPLSEKTCSSLPTLSPPRCSFHHARARTTSGASAHDRGSSVLFASSRTSPRFKSTSAQRSDASSSVRNPSRSSTPYARRRRIGMSLHASSARSSSGYKHSFAFAFPLRGSQCFGIGDALTCRAGYTASDITRRMTWATCRRVAALFVVGTFAMTNSKCSKRRSERRSPPM
jgi:hypothetical protein